MRFAVTGALTLGLALACGGFDPGSMMAAGPPRGAEPLPPREADSSVVPIPVVIPFTSIASAVQDRMPETLFEEELELKPDVKVALVVQRPMGVDVAHHEGGLRIRVPLAADASRVRKRATIRKNKRLGIEMPKGASITATLAMDIEIAYAIDDWAVEPTVQITPMIEGPATLTVESERFDVTKHLQATLTERTGEFESQITQLLAEQVDLRPRLEALWNDLTEPTDLGNGRWLTVDGDALLIGPPDGAQTQPEPDAVRIDLALRSTITVGDPPPEPTKPTPGDAEPLALPDPETPSEPELALDVSFRLPWADLEETTRSALPEQWPVAGVEDEATLTHTGLTLYPSGSHVVVELDYAAASEAWPASGTLWIWGVPTLEGRKVSLTDVEFAPESDDWSDAPIDAETLRTRMVLSVTEALVVDLTEPMESQHEALTGPIEAVELPSGSVFHGVLDPLQVSAVHPDDAGLELRARVSGDAYIELPEPP